VTDQELDLAVEIKRTQPDYVVYRPKSTSGEETRDGGNEHFLVFDGPDGSLMAVWTQSTTEGFGDHRIMFARSDDAGVTWTEPMILAGTWDKDSGHELQASWGFPLVSRSGRIYVLWNQYRGKDKIDFHHQMTGTMDGRFSDDNGKTWSEPETVPMPRSIYDHPDPEMPGNWIVWQRPDRIAGEKYLVGYTRWVSPERRRPLDTFPDGRNRGWSTDSLIEFMRFDNVDEDPAVKDLAISWFAWGEKALKVPYFRDPLNVVAQEPSIVRLPDERLFCVMRTMTGYIWYSLSEDRGETWCSPRPMLRKDHGAVIEEPICCCPIYPLAEEGRYFLINHLRKDRLEYDDCTNNRWPVYVALGEFRPDAEQPVWFSESKQLMTHDGVGLGPRRRTDLGVYPSVTHRDGRTVLWHPDRKFFLLGKEITPEILSGLTVPRT